MSAQTVSKAAKRLDEAIEELRSRPLGETPVLLADAPFAVDPCKELAFEYTTAVDGRQ